MTSAQGQQHAARVAFRRISMLKTAFGPAIASALDDDNVTEIIANPDGALWIERAGSGRERADASMAAADVERIIRLVASALDTVCDQEHPIISGELPGTGERFEGVLPPVSNNPAFTIRKPSKIVIPLDDYVAAGAHAVVGDEEQVGESLADHLRQWLDVSEEEEHDGLDSEST